MRIATFNINGVVKRLANLVEWLSETQPDVVAMQEIKCTDAAFPQRQLEAAGYGAVWRGQGPHHGVAILARGAEPILTRRELPGAPADLEARYIEAAVNGILIGCLYLPNGNPQPGPKFAYKLAWFERLNRYAAELIVADMPAVLLGDYNVVPTDGDIYDMRSWRWNALVQPEPRAAYARLLGQGWTDTIAETHGYEPGYTFWAYLRDSWSRDAGCGSTPCSSPPAWRTAWPTRGSTARCVAGQTPATTRPPGSSSPRDRPRCSAAVDAHRHLLTSAISHDVPVLFTGVAMTMTMSIQWAGISFCRVGHHDGRFFHEPGLFAFARTDAGQGAVLLFASHADDLAREAGPAHPAWTECLRLGMNELHICRPVPGRIDRLQLLARVIQRAQPILNVLAEAHPAPELPVPIASRSAA